MPPIPHATTRRRSSCLAAAALAIVSALLAAASGGSAAASPGARPATVFLSPTGSDAGPCSRTRPCRSFDRAYRVARPGTVVEVAAGTYGAQTLGLDPSKRSPKDVVFRPAAGAAVTVRGELKVSAAHLELRNMTLTDLDFGPEANDVTVRNVVNNGIWMEGPSNISIIGGEVTCGACGFHPILQNAGSKPPRNILFDHVRFHDWQSRSGEHVECLQILGGDRITIRNSTFRNCGTARDGLGATADLHLQTYGSPAPRNILVEGNFFYPSGNPFAIQTEDFENMDLRYNSIAGPILIYDGPAAGTGIDIVGNVMQMGRDCTASGSGVPIEWSYNVIQGGTCGATDRNAPSGFVDPRSDLHLRRGAAAVDAGAPRGYPRRDIDGQRRPVGRRADAGADELRASARRS